jgi:Uma2 family endonuclease
MNFPQSKIFNLQSKIENSPRFAMSSPLKATVPTADQVTILRGVSWRTYDSLLADIGDARSPRLAFQKGTLELMSPSFWHERLGAFLGLLVTQYARARGIRVVGARSMTMRREDLERGVEPDGSFFIAGAEKMRRKREFNPLTDPPPDLVTEVDITSGSLDKFSIYQAFGVAEIWHYADPDGFSLFGLEETGYVKRDFSLSFPTLAAETIRQTLREFEENGESDALDLFDELTKEV